MSGPSTLWLFAVIGLAAAAALVRLGLWWRAAPPPARGPVWRFPTLIALNMLVAAMLYLTLDPPDVGLRAGRLIVLTAGAASEPVLEPGDVAVTLPEGPQGGPAERVPDVATALRRHSQVRGVVVSGTGFTARDRRPPGRPLAFVPPPAPPRGLIALTLPGPVAPGAAFGVSGRVGAMAGGTVELVDPAGAVIDRAAVTADAVFTVSGAARAAGLALFGLRLKDAGGTVIERIDIPVEARDQPPPRIRVLAGAPGPETRFLRRWAEGAGIDLSVQLSLGAGVDLTAGPAPLTVQTLAETDLLVIDDRRWETLGGPERAAVRAALGGGMGLLLRPSGPLPEATRRDWAALGADLRGGETTRPVVLEGEASPPSSAPVEGALEPSLPELTRRDFVQSGPDGVTVLRDADAQPLARWRPYGRGRVGVWTVTDSYGLVLTGNANRYGEVWSTLFSALARPIETVRIAPVGLVRAGERSVLCGVTERASVLAPDGTRRGLVVDPRAGRRACAAYWPTREGWHVARDAEGVESPFFSHPADATPSLLAAERSQATLDLAATSEARAAGPAATRSAGSPWPWFMALLAALTALWWLERRRPDAARVANP